MRSSDIKSLQDCQLFAGLTEDEVKKLIGISEFKQLAKGEILFKEKDVSRNLYVVIEGCLG